MQSWRNVIVYEILLKKLWSVLISIIDDNINVSDCMWSNDNIIIGAQRFAAHERRQRISGGEGGGAIDVERVSNISNNSAGVRRKSASATRRRWRNRASAARRGEAGGGVTARRRHLEKAAWRLGGTSGGGGKSGNGSVMKILVQQKKWRIYWKWREIRNRESEVLCSNLSINDMTFNAIILCNVAKYSNISNILYQ